MKILDCSGDLSNGYLVVISSFHRPVYWLSLSYQL